MLLLRWPSLHLCARCRFLEKLPPKLPFDGELWVGRRRFQETVRIVNGPAIGDGWRRVEFHVFDCPVCVYVRVRVCFVKAQAPTTHRVGCPRGHSLPLTPAPVQYHEMDEATMTLDVGEGNVSEPDPALGAGVSFVISHTF